MQAMQIEEREEATPEEQAIISKWVGWGQFPAVFNDYSYKKYYRGYGQRYEPPPEVTQAEAIQKEIDPDFEPDDWESERAELKDLLSAEEWQAAKKSTLNAHFTHPDIVDAHWAMARKLGYTGGRYLEQAAGVGYYLGMMPADLAAKTHSAAVELEPRTGAMLKALYPATRVEVQGFEEYAAPDNF